MHHNSIYSRIIARPVAAPALDCRGRSLCNLHWLISEMSRLQLISRHLLSADLWQFMATAIAVNPLLAKCQLAAVARSFFAYFRTGHLCLWPKLYNWQPVCVFVCVCVCVQQVPHSHSAHQCSAKTGNCRYNLSAFVAAVVVTKVTDISHRPTDARLQLSLAISSV